MPVLSISSADEVGRLLDGGDSPLVTIPVYNAYHDVLACIESVLRHTAHDAPILVVDDAGGDSRAVTKIRDLQVGSERLVIILHHQINSGFVGSCNDAFNSSGRRDVVLVNSDVIVGAHWLERLRAAAYSSSLVATASSLTNHGTLLSVPNLYRPNPQLPGHLTPESAAAAVANGSLRTRPSIPTAIGHCVYIRRSALDLVGGFDPSFGRGYGEEVDFSQRCVALGLKHVCADDVFTFHRGGGSFGAEPSTSQQENEKIVNGRYPWYPDWVRSVENDPSSELTCALVRASVALRGLSIAVDGRALGPELMGTQQVIIETVRTLVDHPHVSRVVLYLSGPIPEYAKTRLSDPRIEFVVAGDEHVLNVEPCDIGYRPFQVWGLGDLTYLKKIGRWTAINQLDCIAYSNPAYFPNSREWLSYRSTTSIALSGVDGIAYLSKSSQDATRSEGLVTHGTSEKIVYTGATFDLIPESEKPATLGNLDGPYLLVLGASYLHKNRPFAVEVLREIRARGREMSLILAGPTPPVGSSTGLEAGIFLDEPELRRYVHVLPSVTEPEKRWLFENAAMALYPTTAEGFGLVPFEAAMYGLATLSTRQGSLDEVLPKDIPSIEGFRATEVAEDVVRLLSDAEARESIVESLRTAAHHFSSEKTTSHLVELFMDMMTRPPKRSVRSLSDLASDLSWTSTTPTEPTVLRINPGFLVRSGWKLRRLKRIVSPDNSRRQAVIRRFSNRTRRLLRR